MKTSENPAPENIGKVQPETVGGRNSGTETNQPAPGAGAGNTNAGAATHKGQRAAKNGSSSLVNSIVSSTLTNILYSGLRMYFTDSTASFRDFAGFAVANVFEGVAQTVALELSTNPILQAGGGVVARTALDAWAACHSGNWPGFVSSVSHRIASVAFVETVASLLFPRSWAFWRQFTGGFLGLACAREFTCLLVYLGSNTVAVAVEQPLALPVKQALDDSLTANAFSAQHEVAATAVDPLKAPGPGISIPEAAQGPSVAPDEVNVLWTNVSRSAEVGELHVQADCAGSPADIVANAAEPLRSHAAPLADAVLAGVPQARIPDEVVPHTLLDVVADRASAYLAERMRGFLRGAVGISSRLLW
jgi:hypothetical protein